MLSESTLHQYANMECNNEYNSPFTNDKIPPSNNSSVLTLASTSVTSINDEVYSSQNPIHQKINYSDLSKTWVRSVCRASDAMDTQVKLLAKKALNDVIPEKNL